MYTGPFQGPEEWRVGPSDSIVQRVVGEGTGHQDMQTLLHSDRPWRLQLTPCTVSPGTLWGAPHVALTLSCSFPPPFCAPAHSTSHCKDSGRAGVTSLRLEGLFRTPSHRPVSTSWQTSGIYFQPFASNPSLQQEPPKPLQGGGQRLSLVHPEDTQEWALFLSLPPT